MAANLFSPLVDPRNFGRSLFLELRPEDDPRYVAAAKRADEFEQRELSKEARELLLKHADAKYGERIAELEHLDKKREWLITFSMGAVTFLVGAQQIAGRALAGWTGVFFVLTVICFLVAIGVLLLSRRVVTFPTRFTIQELREGLKHEGMTEQEDWVAASLHKTCEALRVHEDAIGAHMNFALCWIFAALFWLAIIAISGPVPKASTASPAPTAAASE